jgi:hypothetical protein
VYCYNAIRFWQKTDRWNQSFKGDLLVSGEDPVEEHRRMEPEEVDELDDWLKDIVAGAQEDRRDRLMDRDDWSPYDD